MRTSHLLFLSVTMLSACYESRERVGDGGQTPDATLTNDSATNQGVVPMCELSDCHRVINARVGLLAVNGAACCFEANCTDPNPVRRAWVIACHNGVVHSVEVNR